MRSQLGVQVRKTNKDDWEQVEKKNDLVSEQIYGDL